MVRRAVQKSRGQNRHQRKCIILIGAEGTNKTERIYFRNFNRIQQKYHVQIATGNATNPVGIVADIKKNRDKMDFQNDDLAFAVFDADLWQPQSVQIQKAMCDAGQAGIKVILSNPCFEVWFVLHFDESTASYNSSKDVINKLRTYITCYEKNKNLFENLQESMNTALSRAEKLRAYHKKNGTILSAQNPMTDVDELVRVLYE